MPTAKVNGAPVAMVALTWPMYGAWSADIVLPVDGAVTSPATLTIGDLSLVGTVVRQAGYTGDRMARIVGGGGGWKKTLPPKGYSLPAGVRNLTVLTDAATECGETISVPSPSVIGVHWARSEGPAEETLRAIAGSWYIDDAGVTQITARPSAEITSPFTVLDRFVSRGMFSIATEFLSVWRPGNTFRSNTVAETQTISSVSIDISNEGKARVTVTTGDLTPNALLDDIRAIIRAEMWQQKYSQTWAYKVQSSSSSSTTIDCIPVDPSMPPLTKVPTDGMGKISPPSTGTTCQIGFVDGDPAKPRVVSIGATSEHLMTTEACALLIYNVLGSIGLTVGAVPLTGAVLALGTLPAILSALSAQSAPAPSGLSAQVALAAITGATMAAGSPSNTIGPIAAALSFTKTPDISGLFPGIGVPNE